MISFFDDDGGKKGKGLKNRVYLCAPDSAARRSRLRVPSVINTEDAVAATNFVNTVSSK